MTLEARGVVLRLGGEVVLDGVTAAFAPGRVTAVLGPNGAGKSSLLACLAGLRRPDAGAVQINGRERASWPARDLARHIGFLPQEADVHWDINVATLVALGRLPHRGRWGGTPDDAAAVAAAMAATDVTALSSRIVSTLSGGERSRVLLARVLAGTPKWLLADEPLASLDPAHQLDVLARLRALACAGIGVVVVLHDLNQAMRVADDVLLLRDSRVVAFGPTATVMVPERIAETYGVATEIGRSAHGQSFIITTGRLPG